MIDEFACSQDIFVVFHLLYCFPHILTVQKPCGCRRRSLTAQICRNFRMSLYSTIVGQCFPWLAYIRAIFESVKWELSIERHHSTTMIVTSRVGVGPVLQFPPVPAHPILVVASATLAETGASWRVICITDDLLSESIKAMIYMREVEALWYFIVHLCE